MTRSESEVELVRNQERFDVDLRLQLRVADPKHLEALVQTITKVLDNNLRPNICDITVQDVISTERRGRLYDLTIKARNGDDGAALELLRLMSVRETF